MRKFPLDFHFHFHSWIPLCLKYFTAIEAGKCSTVAALGSRSQSQMTSPYISPFCNWNGQINCCEKLKHYVGVESEEFPQYCIIVSLLLLFFLLYLYLTYCFPINFGFFMAIFYLKEKQLKGFKSSQNLCSGSFTHSRLSDPNG